MFQGWVEGSGGRPARAGPGRGQGGRVGRLPGRDAVAIFTTPLYPLFYIDAGL